MGFGESERGHKKIDVEWQLKRTWRSSQFHKANCSKCFLVDRVGSATRSRVLERDSERERESKRERASKRARERERGREKLYFTYGNNRKWVPGAYRRCQALTDAVKRCQALTSAGRRCQALSSAVKRCQALTEAVKRCQALTNAGRR